jgi:hypothetical protein
MRNKSHTEVIDAILQGAGSGEWLHLKVERNTTPRHTAVCIPAYAPDNVSPTLLSESVSPEQAAIPNTPKITTITKTTTELSLPPSPPNAPSQHNFVRRAFKAVTAVVSTVVVKSTRSSTNRSPSPTKPVIMAPLGVAYFLEDEDDACTGSAITVVGAANAEADGADADAGNMSLPTLTAAMAAKQAADETAAFIAAEIIATQQAEAEEAAAAADADAADTTNTEAKVVASLSPNIKIKTATIPVRSSDNGKHAAMCFCLGKCTCVTGQTVTPTKATQGSRLHMSAKSPKSPSQRMAFAFATASPTNAKLPPPCFCRGRCICVTGKAQTSKNGISPKKSSTKRSSPKKKEVVLMQQTQQTQPPALKEMYTPPAPPTDRRERSVLRATRRAASIAAGTSPKTSPTTSHSSPPPQASSLDARLQSIVLSPEGSHKLSNGNLVFNL